MNARLFVLCATSHASKIVVEMISCVFLHREETTMRTSQHLASSVQAKEFMRRNMPEAETGPPLEMLDENESSAA